MNKFIKIAFSLIITGIILIGFATYLNNGNIPRFSANYEKKNYTISADNIKNLDLNIKNNYIVVDKDYKTNIDKCYAVGDVIEKRMYQIINSAAEGAEAAFSINKDNI